MSRALTCVALVALSASLASSARAQRVLGKLTDSGTGQPIGGAVVTLSDATGAFLSHGISDPDGQFYVMRLAPTRALRVARIGFKPREVVVGVDSIINLEMQPIAPILPIVATRAGRICKGGPESDAAFELWDQARTALRATVIARDVSPLTVHLHRYTRNYDAFERRMLSDSSEYDDLTVDRSFVAARTPASFAQQGYLRELINGNREYYAPDEAVLIDPTFVEQHCLWRVDGTAAHANQVGIAFEPIADAAHDTLVDIAGTLWLDRERPELRELELRYTNLEPGASSTGAVLTFAAMPNGVSMVTRWKITSARLEVSGLVTRTGYRLDIPRTRRTNTQIIGYDESGGEITEVDWRDTRRELAALPQARGQVVDATGAGVPGVLVWLKDGKDTTRTDATGNYALPHVRPGIYYLYAADSVMAGEGLAQTLPTRAALMGTGATVSLQFHSRSDVLASICPPKSYRPGTAVLRARVTDSRGRPAGNARIEVQFGVLNDSAGRVQLPQARRGEADLNGVFTICGIPPTKALVLRALKDNEGAGIVIDQWTDDIATVTIPLSPITRTPF